MAKILVTSALPYVNNIPHLGNLIGAVLSADVFSRHKRLQGHDVLYVCGADEHGTTTEIKAREEGLKPQELCDKYGKIHKDIYDWFNIAFDVWGRTHTSTHEKITQEIFTRLYDNGYVQEEEVEQLYDEEAKQYLSDRFVEGNCPHCGEAGARGDQCDSCQKLVNATELKKPISKLTGTTPVVKKTKHLFIDLPKLSGVLEPWLETVSDGWSNNTITTTEQWIANIKSRAITRDLEWGVPVPLEGYKDKVFYVWFDAPIGYISITAHARKDWESWWKNPEVALTQFMGKDNIVFHSVIFPSTLLGTNDVWNMVDNINATEFLNMENTKFSKSNQTGVFGDDCIAIEKKYSIPADAWRYYLLSVRPEQADSVFSWNDFQAKTNNELIATYGNLVHRTLHFAHKNNLGKTTLGEKQQQFLNEVAGQYDGVQDKLDAAEIKSALQDIMKIAKQGNQYFQHAKPWETIKTAPEEAEKDILVLATLVRDLSILLHPYIPEGAETTWDLLGLKELSYEALGVVDHELLTRVKEPTVLYGKLEDEVLADLRETYSPETTPLDLRVAKILEVKEHPDAKKLIVLKIDLGTEKRTLVAGLKEHYEEKELEGKHIIVVTNLEPAKLRGVKSEGMLLASEGKDKKIGLLLTKAKPGTKITIGGKNGSEKLLSFQDFQKHKILSTKEQVTMDGEPLEGADIIVDREAYGTVR